MFDLGGGGRGSTTTPSKLIPWKMARMCCCKIRHLSPMQTLILFSIYKQNRVYNWGFSGQLGCGVGHDMYLICEYLINFCINSTLISPDKLHLILLSSAEGSDTLCQLILY